MPGSLQNNRRLDGWIRINADGTADRLHRQGRARAGHPHRARADRGRGARPAARAHQDDLRRHRPDAERRADRRQPVDREQRHGAAAWRAPRRARSCSTSPPSGSASPPISSKVADGVDHGAGRPQGHLRRTRREARSQSRSNGQSRAEAAGEPQDRRQIDRRASTFRQVTGGAVYVQDMRLPGMVHGRVVRPPRYGSTLDSVDEAAVKAMPGVIAVVRDGSFLGVVAEREEQAIKAREALRQEREMEARARVAGSGAHLSSIIKSLPSKDATHRRQAGARCCRRRPHLRGDLHQPYMAHASIGPSVRGRRVQGRQA